MEAPFQQTIVRFTVTFRIVEGSYKADTNASPPVSVNCYYMQIGFNIDK
jgi:hypothetical protein